MLKYYKAYAVHNSRRSHYYTIMREKIIKTTKRRMCYLSLTQEFALECLLRIEIFN